GCFVPAEHALVKVRPSHVEVNPKPGRRVEEITQHIVGTVHAYFLTAQLGISLSSLALGCLGVLLIVNVFTEAFALVSSLSQAAAFFIIAIIHIIFGEVIPKSIAIRRPISTALSVALPLRFLSIIFSPITWSLNGIANSLLRLLGFRTNVNEVYHSAE